MKDVISQQQYTKSINTELLILIMSLQYGFNLLYAQDDKADVVANDAGDRVTPAVVAFTETEQVISLWLW